MEARIAELIEEEVERRVSERLTKVLEHISRTYDVSMKQLMRDTSTLKVDTGMCMGMTAKNKRCGNKACRKSNNGYCTRHQNQKPIMTKSVSTDFKNIHNHSSDKFFVKGCPGCEKKSRTELLIEI